jgi:hypothetical protein
VKQYGTCSSGLLRRCRDRPFPEMKGENGGGTRITLA